MHGSDPGGSVDTIPPRAPVIVLVEDDPADEAAALGILRRAHVANDVIVLRDAAQALDHLFAVARDGDAPSLCVLLDVTLPGLDGIEILQRMRAERATAHLPVVMLITDIGQDVELHRRKLETWSAVRKPLDLDQFLTAVRRLGLSWMVLSPANAASAEAAAVVSGVAGPSETGPPTRVTTSDHCPSCHERDIEPVNGTRAAFVSRTWRCRRCGIVFLRVSRRRPPAVADRGARLASHCRGLGRRSVGRTLRVVPRGRHGGPASPRRRCHYVRADDASTKPGPVHNSPWPAGALRGACRTARQDVDTLVGGVWHTSGGRHSLIPSAPPPSGVICARVRSRIRTTSRQSPSPGMTGVPTISTIRPWRGHQVSAGRMSRVPTSVTGTTGRGARGSHEASAPDGSGTPGAT